MKYFVTLFDSNYLTRGLVLYRSLLRHCPNFHLWIICFDQIAFDLLTELNLSHVTPVSLQQFEDEELLKIKSTRSLVEYYWTCTPSTCLYVLNNDPTVDQITYLDADLMFFSDPEPIFSEMDKASILLIEHRYLTQFDQSVDSGIFNVQFMTFVRDEDGLKALNWWRDRCIEWCYMKLEDNKFGDQKYLDDFPKLFKNVHVLQHIGGGLAPWNADKYSITLKDEQIFVDSEPLIFYHFHAFKIHPFKITYVCNLYPINDNVRQYIYKRYCVEIYDVYKSLREKYLKFNYGIVGILGETKTTTNLIKSLKQLLRGMIYEGRYMLNI
jgi:hypothetical protein